MWLLAGFLAVPLIEIALFVTVGGRIGLWPTLAIVIATGVAGAGVIRQQGLQTIEGLRQATFMRRNPLGLMADSALICLAGVFLILPGFLTDTLGLLLLVPQVRSVVLRRFAPMAHVHARHDADGPGRSGADVIDGEFFEVGRDQTSPAQPVARFPEGRQH